MTSVNTAATHKFVIVLNEKAPIGKLLSATGQLAMSVYADATEEQRSHMDFVPFASPNKHDLITITTCSFVVLKASPGQLHPLFLRAREQGLLSAFFTSTMSYNGIEEDLLKKTAETPLDQVEPYGVGIFGTIHDLIPLTKKFTLFKI